MKYLVTGGAGFIGSNLVDRLIGDGHEVVVVDNLSSGKKENLNPKAIFYQVDICDTDALKKLFSGVDYVFHLAAIPRVSISVKDPVLTSKVNILGTLNVFEAAARAKVKRVIFISSSAVYGDNHKKNLKESETPNPISPYGLQKLVGEQFAKLFSKLYNIPIISLRFFNVYGPRIDFDSDYGLVVGKFLYFKHQGKPLTIFGDGRQTRGFFYVDDAIGAAISATQSPKLIGGEVINVSANRSDSVKRIAQIVGGPVVYLPPKPGDPLHVSADIALAKKLLNWKPTTTLEEGIKKTDQWFQRYLSR